MSEIRYYGKELGEKNFKTMNDVLKTQRDMIIELQEAKIKKDHEIIDLKNKIISLESKINVILSMAAGHGSTS